MTTPPVCDYEGSDYQQSFWDQGGRDYEDQAEAIALKKLLPKNGKHLLELGAGAGRNTPRYGGFDQVTLVDYSTTQLGQAIERLGDGSRYRFIAADIYRLPFGPNSFDAATMIRTIHHFSDPEKALAQVSSCLTGGAVFILEFANKRNIKALFRYVFKRQDWNPFSRDAIEFAELNFDFHPKSIKRVVEDEGFEIQRQISVSYLRAGFFKKLPLGVLIPTERILQALLSWTAYSPSIFLKMVKRGQEIELNEDRFFRCPACSHYPLEDTPPLITCDSCGRSYPMKDGIYDFRIKD